MNPTLTFIMTTLIIKVSCLNTDYISLIEEIERNAWAYIPRVRYEKEVQNCDIILHDGSLFVENKVNMLTSSNNVNHTIKERVEISHRPYYYRQNYNGRGPSFTRARKLYIETERHKMADISNREFSI